MVHAATEPLPFVPGKLVEISRPVSLDHEAIEQQARETLSRWSKGAPIAEVRCDPADIVREVTSADTTFLGVEREECVGRHFDLVYPLLRMRYGNMTTVHRQDREQWIDRYIGFTSLDLVERSMRMLTWPVREEMGAFAGSKTFATTLDEPFRRGMIETL
jgi:hypothetical protein